MTPSYPTSIQRTVLQRLRADQWRTVAKLNVAVGEGLLSRLAANGWTEQRGQGRTLELKLTIAGLEALRMRIPDSPSLRKAVRAGELKPYEK